MLKLALLLVILVTSSAQKRENTLLADQEFIKHWAEQASILEKPALEQEITSLKTTCKSLEESHHRQGSEATTNEAKQSLTNVWEKTERPRYHDNFDIMVIYMRVAETHFKDLKYTIDDDLVYNDLDRRGQGYHVHFLETVNKFIKNEMKATRQYRRAIGDL